MANSTMLKNINHTLLYGMHPSIPKLGTIVSYLLDFVELQNPAHIREQLR